MRKSIDHADGPYVGIIRRYLGDKGFAFVQRVDVAGNGRPEDYFLHNSGTEIPGLFDTWAEGTWVEFHGQLTDKGLRAVRAKEYDGEITPAMQAVVDQERARADRARQRRDSTTGY